MPNESGVPGCLRSLAASGVAAVALLGGQMVGAPSASADTSATVEAQTQRMSDATLASRQDGSYNAGDQVTLVCSKRGQDVFGLSTTAAPGRGSDLWYQTSDGHFVADVDLATSSPNAAAPDCGATAQGSTAPQSATAPQALSAPQTATAPQALSAPQTATTPQALTTPQAMTATTTDPVRTVGRTSTVNPGTLGQCTWGAAQKWFEVTGSYPAVTGDAWTWRESAAAAGWTVVDGAQERSVVVFQPGVAGAGGYGHVAFVDSVTQRPDGRWIHVTEMNNAYLGGVGIFDDRDIKDVPGMSYILMP